MIRKLVNVSVANMSSDVRVNAVSWVIGTWTRSGDAKNANVISMEVSMRIAIFIPASVFASLELKVPNVIDAKADFMDSQ